MRTLRQFEATTTAEPRFIAGEPTFSIPIMVLRQFEYATWCLTGDKPSEFMWEPSAITASSLNFPGISKSKALVHGRPF
jgi:hypothetical protein